MKSLLPVRLVLLWAVFVVRGSFYAHSTPLWEGFDEPAHYGLILHLAEDGEWPARTDALPGPVVQSLSVLPLPPLLAGESGWTHDRYWKLPAAERVALETAFREGAAGASPQQRYLHYEAQQAPLYYWVCAAIHRALPRWPLADQVLAMRLLTLLWASLLVPATYGIGAALAGSSTGWTAALLLAAMPQVAMTASRVANDGPAGALAAIALLYFLRCRPSGHPVRSAVWGVLTGLAMLTKAYLIVLAPVFGVVAVWEIVRASTRRRHVLAALCFGVAVATVAGWWYWQTAVGTGSLSGEQLEMAAQGSLRGGRMLTMPLSNMPWWRAVDFIAKSHLWLGNWSFLGVRSWMYHLLYGLVAVAGVGTIVALFRRRRRLASGWLAVYLFEAAMLAAVLYHSLVSYVVQRVPGTFGHYLDGAIAAEAVLLAIGARTTGGTALPKVLGLCLLLVEGFGTHAYLLPYYAGSIAHDGQGNLAAFPAVDSGLAAIDPMARRLAVNKASWVSAGWLELHWVVYLLSLLSIAALLIISHRYKLTVKAKVSPAPGIEP